MASRSPNRRHASPKRSPGRSPDLTGVTRFGRNRPRSPQFGDERRFKWQDPQFESDVMYTLPSTMEDGNAQFGSSTRLDRAKSGPNPPVASNPTTGPGCYDLAKAIDASSMHVTHKAIRFPTAPREGLAQKTPSPGAVYQLEGVFKDGPDKRLAVSFNRDQRKPLHEGTDSAGAQLYMPRESRGQGITFGKRCGKGILGNRTETPGPEYELGHWDFRTGPAHTFGKSRTKRFNY